MRYRERREVSAGTCHATALARGYLARRCVAHMRKFQKEAAKSDPKRLVLRRRLDKVSGASTVVASCIIANAASRRRARARVLRTAVEMVRLGGIENGDFRRDDPYAVHVCVDVRGVNSASAAT